MSETPDEIALPHFEDRLRTELEWLHRQRQPSPTAAAETTATGRWHRPGRWSLLAGAAALVVAVALVVTQVVAEDGPGGSDAVTQPDPEPTPEAEPELVEASLRQRIIEATEAVPDDAIIHERGIAPDYSGIPEGDGIVVEDQNGNIVVYGPDGEEMAVEQDGDIVDGEPQPPDGPTRYADTWSDPITGARRYRVENADGDPISDSGWPEPPTIGEQPDPALGAPFVPGIGACDPGTRLVMDAEGNLVPCDPGPPGPPQPYHAERIVDHCGQQYIDTTGPIIRHPGFGYIRLFLESGDIFQVGTEELDGRELIKLRNADGYAVMLVDPETYLPAQVTLDGTTTTIEFLPRTAENLALVSPEVPDGFRQVVADDWQSVELADC